MTTARCTEGWRRDHWIPRRPGIQIQVVDALLARDGHGLDRCAAEKPYVVYSGSGDIAERLGEHRRDRRIIVMLRELFWEADTPGTVIVMQR